MNGNIRKIMVQKIGICSFPTYANVISLSKRTVDWANKPLYTYIIEVERHRLTERFYHDIMLQHGFQGSKMIE